MGVKKQPPLFRFSPFSMKQLQVLTWWIDDDSPYKEYDGVICDGSVRAGKTVVMSLSYVMFVMHTFNKESAGMAGKTIGSFRRNVYKPLQLMLMSRGYRVRERRTDNMFIVSKDGKENYFYYFGGKDESSQDLVQGMTLSSFFFDEVALMPQSFVDQAVARCSVEGSKLFFNCNPAGPHHWFKVEYLDKKEQKNLFQIHFLMEDNPSLSKGIIERYKRMYSGIFYQRFILGLWVLSQGIIYDMFEKERHIVKTVERNYEKYYVAIDYGTQNPTTFGLWGLFEGVWYKVKEYHYDGRKNGKQKADKQYADDLLKFIDGLHVSDIIVDPSAASFIQELRSRGLSVRKAKNDVNDGIRNMASALEEGKILYNDVCKETFKEFASYVWDSKAADRGEDKPVKDNDHQLDADRYFVNTVLFGAKQEVKTGKSIYGRRRY